MRTVGSVLWLVLLSCAAASSVLFLSIIALFSGVLDGITSGLIGNSDDSTIIKICVVLAASIGTLVFVLGMFRIVKRLVNQRKKQPIVKNSKESVESSTQD